MNPWSFYVRKRTRIVFIRTCKVCVILWCLMCFLRLNQNVSRNESGLTRNQIPTQNEVIHKQRIDLKLDGDYQSNDRASRPTTTESPFSQDSSDVRFFSNLTLIIVVCSHPEHVQLRQTIRSTWGKHVKHLHTTEVMFLLGRPVDDYWRELTQREMALHGDLVLVDIEETYRNLARKVIMGMKWVVLNVPNVRYYMKCDDDVYINVPGLIKELQDGVIPSTQILGALSPNSKVIRDPRDEWSVPHEVFPAKTFPPYVSGGAYAMPREALKRLVDVAPDEVDVHLEDVYITGILARKAGVSHVSHQGFSFWTSPKAKPCDIISGRRITSVNMSLERIIKLHRQISEILIGSRNPCSNSSNVKSHWI